MRVLLSYSNIYDDMSKLTTPFLPSDLVIRHYPHQDSAFNFVSEEFNNVSKQQTQFVLDELNKMKDNECLLYLEQDVLLLERPEWFANQIKDYDMICQQDQSLPCMGFLVVRNSPQARQSLENTIKATNKVTNNQMAFHTKHNLKVGFFDTKDVWCYGALGMGEWRGEMFEFPETRPRAFHANWTRGKDNKIKLLEMAIKKYNLNP